MTLPSRASKAPQAHSHPQPPYGRHPLHPHPQHHPRKPRTPRAQTPTPAMRPVCAPAGRVVARPACTNVRGPATNKRSRPHPHHKTVRARSGTGTRPAHNAGRPDNDAAGGNPRKENHSPLRAPRFPSLRFPPAPPILLSPLPGPPRGGGIAALAAANTRYRRHATGRPTPWHSKPPSPAGNTATHDRTHQAGLRPARGAPGGEPFPTAPEFPSRFPPHPPPATPPGPPQAPLREAGQTPTSPQRPNCQADTEVHWHQKCAGRRPRKHSALGRRSWCLCWV